MRIAIGSDHAGYLLKETLKAWLLENGHEVTDVGTYSEDRVDYPHYGALVGRAVASGEVDRGVAVCGSGQGICMAANKVPGVRGGGGSPVIRSYRSPVVCRKNRPSSTCSRTRGSSSGRWPGG